jgi:hypothetical protein
LNLKPKNRTKPNPNNPNYRSIYVSGFEFGPNKFIIRSLGSVSVLVFYNTNRPNNPKFNIVVYFDSNYDVTTLYFKLFLNFFMNLLVICFSRVVFKSIELK